jgi:phenylalanyl-tRNA synthetase beta chain
MVLIEDADGPTSIAGVMGGARSEVEPQTTRVLLEAANWDGANIHRTSLKLGLRSEASTRFEKQLQPEQAMEAQAVATQLLIELAGATVRPGTVDIGGPGPKPKTIALREQKVTSLLGASIPTSRQAEILTALEFKAVTAHDGLEVTVPAFRRTDVTREADLIEEVARIDGLDTLPVTLPSRHNASGRLTDTQRIRRAAADALTSQGLHEIVGWSFVGADLQDKLRIPGESAVELENPMSAEQSRLRTRLIGSLLDVAARNRARGATSIRLFEAGAVYIPNPDPTQLPDEPYHVGALLIGPARPATWRDANQRDADFFAVKGVVQGLLDTIRAPFTVAAATTIPFLHPGRAAQIHVGNETVGWIGEIHPRVASGWGIEETVAAFELDLDAVEPHATTTTIYEDLTSFPEVREDIAVIVSDDTTAEQVLKTVEDAGQPLLQHATVFDVYRDADRIGAGNVSLALRLSYRAPDRTLTDDEVAQQRAKIVDALQAQLKGRIRAS